VEELRASSVSEQSIVFVAIAISETEHQVLEKSQFFSTRGPEANRTSKKQCTLKRTTTLVTNYTIYCSQRMGSIKVTMTNGHIGPVMLSA
jgi:hypothetical protein